MTKLEAEVLEKAISTILENVKFYNVCIKEDTDYKVILYSQYFFSNFYLEFVQKPLLFLGS